MGRNICCSEGRFVESVFQSRVGGALSSPLLMDGGGWVWEEDWKGGSGLYQGLKAERNACRETGISGRREGLFVVSCLGSCQGRSIKTRVTE